MSTLHNGLHNKFGLYGFPIFIGFDFVIYRLVIVPKVKCIHAVFAVLWPFLLMLVPPYSAGWSVAKLFWWVYIYIYTYIYIYININSTPDCFNLKTCGVGCVFEVCTPINYDRKQTSIPFHILIWKLLYCDSNFIEITQMVESTIRNYYEPASP